MLYLAASFFDREITGLASIYSFGLMLAFMAVFLAVIKLRFVEPDRPRPVMMRGNVRFGRSLIPLPAVAGFLLSWLVWILALGTHRAGRVVPPLWLLGGVIVFVIVRRRAGLPVLGHAGRGEELELPDFAEVPYGTIIVPCKQAGPIEDEMLATASKLAQFEGGKVIALKVIEVPLEESLDCSMPEEDRASSELLALCESFATDYEIEVECRVLRARAISSAVAHEARESDAGLILVGAVPRPWDAAGRAHVFSDTVENVIRRSHCRVIVTSFPAGTASVDEDRHAAMPVGRTPSVGAPVKPVGPLGPTRTGRRTDRSSPAPSGPRSRRRGVSRRCSPPSAAAAGSRAAWVRRTRSRRWS